MSMVRKGRDAPRPQCTKVHYGRVYCLSDTVQKITIGRSSTNAGGCGTVQNSRFVDKGRLAAEPIEYACLWRYQLIKQRVQRAGERKVMELRPHVNNSLQACEHLP